jgi:PAS domain S-box-containing protein
MAKHNIENALERSIFEQQAEAEALFTSIGDGAISTDEFGRITRVNPVAQSILGYSEKELIGQWFPKKIVAVNPDGTLINLIDRPITRAFLTGKTVTEKMMYRTKSGESVAIATNVSPILLNGVPIGAIEVFRDITLEQEVDRMKSEFISLASHQLRTPLSAIKTYSHMIVDGYMGDINDTQKKSLRTIISAANRMNELISTLLNITRMESGTIAVTPKLLQLDQVCEEVVKELSLMATEQSVSLELKNVGDDPKPVRSDNLIIKEILSNLITNAIKYTPENGNVTVSVKAKDTEVVVSIKDTGWGIPKHAQDQIFSKFFRAQNIVKRETTGTGLGLYLVQGLVEAVGGKIWFKSAEGKGTTFSFSLPKSRKITKKVSTKPAPAM